MVWLHGGGWVNGGGSARTYDASHLARRGDVVVVTINYRLGALRLPPGPGARGRADGTGNEAMLDQVAALEWVRDEIAAFGGDPGNVTVFGESAGSVNIACLLTMPRARGLFHRAVLQSGSLNLTRPPSLALDAARQVLAELGIAPEHAHRLRDVSAKDLMDGGERRRRTLGDPAVLAGGRRRVDPGWPVRGRRRGLRPGAFP